MKEFNDYLEERGLGVWFSDDTGVRRRCRNIIRRTEVESGFQQLCDLITEGMQIVVVDVDKMATALEMDPEYEKIKDIIGENTHIQIWDGDSYFEPQFDLSGLRGYESVRESVMEQLKTNPEKYGVSENETKLQLIFDANAMQEKAEQITDLYYDFLEDEDSVRVDRSIMLFDLKDEMEDKTFDLEWFEEGIKKSDEVNKKNKSLV